MLEELVIYNKNYGLVAVIKVKNGVVVDSTGISIPVGTAEKIAIEKIKKNNPSFNIIKGKLGEHNSSGLAFNGGIDYKNAISHEDPWAVARNKKT